MGWGASGVGGGGGVAAAGGVGGVGAGVGLDGSGVFRARGIGRNCLHCHPYQVF